MNNLFDYQEKKKNPIGIMNLDFSTDLTPYVPVMDKVILDRVENRLGLDPNKLLDFAYQVSGMESDHNPMPRNPDSTAKGQYQLTDATFITAKNRLKRIMGVLPDRIVNAETVLDLSPDDQRSLFLAHLTEDKGSDERMQSYLTGDDSGWDLYLYNHYKGDPTPNTLKRRKKYFP